MAKYLATSTFTAEGLAGLRAAGAASRVAAGHVLAASVGGTLEAYYFAFGDVDAYAILDLPDDEAAAAASMAANSAGSVNVTVTKLLTAAQIDEAFSRSVDYRKPGG